jgi:hypothetical protein
MFGDRGEYRVEFGALGRRFACLRFGCHLLLLFVRVGRDAGLAAAAAGTGPAPSASRHLTSMAIASSIFLLAVSATT